MEPNLYYNPPYVTDEELAQNSGSFSRGTYSLSATVPSGSSTQLSWAESGGVVQDHILDLNDPLNPAGLVAGLYTVTVVIQPDGDTVSQWIFDLNLDFNGEDQDLSVFVPPQGDIGPPPGFLSISYPMPESGVIAVTARQTSGGEISFTGHAYVVVLT